MQKIKSPQTRKERLNVESMLSFNGVDQYASAGVNQNVINATEYTNNFSIGFFAFVNNLADQFIVGAYINNSGLSVALRFRNGLLRPRLFMRPVSSSGNKDQEGNISLQINRLYYIVVNYNSSTQIPEFYVNGVNVGRIHVSDITLNSTLYSSIHDLRIGMNRNMNNESYANAAVSHLTFFNRTLTETEVRSIHRNGGLLPESTHANCVAHYPMTQREGEWLYDQVEQYNYSKPGQTGFNDQFTSRYLYNNEVFSFQNNKPAESRYRFKWVLTEAGGDSIEADFKEDNTVDCYENGVLVATINDITLQASFSRNLSNGRFHYGGILRASITTSSTNSFFARLFIYYPNTSFEGTYSSNTGNFLSVGNSDTLEFKNGNPSKKIGVLKPYHALLKNYTEAEHTGSAQTAWKDFYSKEQYINSGFKVGGTRLNSPFSSNTGIANGGSFSVVLKGTLTGAKTGFILHTAYQGNAGNIFIRYSENLGQFTLFTLNGNGGVSTGISLNGNFEGIFTIGLTYNSADFTTRLIAYRNSTLIGEGTYTTRAWEYNSNYGNGSRFFVGRANFGSGNAMPLIFDWAMKPEFISMEQLKSYCRDFLGSTFHFKFPRSLNQTVRDFSGNNHHGSVSYDSVNTFSNPENYLEKSSLLPPIRRGLRFDGVNDRAVLPSNAIPNSFRGYYHAAFYLHADPPYTDNPNVFWVDASGFFTLVISNEGYIEHRAMIFNSNNGFRLAKDGIPIKLKKGLYVFTMSNNNGVLNFYLNGTKFGYIMAVGSDTLAIRQRWFHTLNSNGITGVWLAYDSFNVAYSDISIHDFHIGDYVPNPKEVISWHNNGLLANPKTKPFYKLDFNNIIDNNGTYEVVNNGSAGGNAVLSGYNQDDLLNQPFTKIRKLENIRLNKRYPPFYPKSYPNKS